MGASQTTLTSEDIAELQDPQISGFSTRQINEFYKRFQKLDRTNSGYISEDEFHLIPELSMNPLASRIIDHFSGGLDRCNFKNFVRALWTFSPKNSAANKIACVFQCYDVDGDGYISGTDLFHVLKMMVGTFIDDDQLREIAEQTIRDANRSDSEQKLSLDDFSKVVTPKDVNSLLTIQM